MLAERIDTTLAEHAQAVESVLTLRDTLVDCATRMRKVIQAGGSIYACGNGGSAADAQHFAAELTGRFERERRGYPVVALTTDTSALTAIGNDYGFESIFSRQLEAVGRAGDLLLAISTSGNSTNIVEAVKQAKNMGVQTVGLLGRDGGRLAGLVDLALVVNVERTARIQEAHILILHLLCELFEAGEAHEN